jgi:hypothetical protein
VRSDEEVGHEPDPRPALPTILPPDVAGFERGLLLDRAEVDLEPRHCIGSGFRGIGKTLPSSVQTISHGIRRPSAEHERTAAARNSFLTLSTGLRFAEDAVRVLTFAS